MPYDWATQIKVEFHLDVYNTTEEVLDAIQSLKKIGGGTWTHDAILLALNEMVPYSPDDRDTILVLVTDGRPSTYQGPCSLLPTIQSLNVRTAVVGIGEDLIENLHEVSCM